MKKLLITLLCCVILYGCATKQESSIEETQIDSIVNWDENDLDSDYSDEDIQTITLKEDSIAFEGEGATISKTTITITKAGTYRVSGTILDGSIIVDTTSDALVRIILDDATITCANSSPIYIKQADKVLLTLADNTNNKLIDTANYVITDAIENEPSATIFSKDDLTINGSGALTIEANYNNGIQSKDDLKIVSGIIDVTSIDDGLVGKDLLAIKNADISLQTQSDGMKTTNIDESDKGNMAIEGGSIQITSQNDGMQAANGLYIYDGSFTIQSGGGSINNSQQATMDNGMPWGQWSSSSEEDSASAKGLKSTNLTEVTGGSFNLDTSDDAIHSNGILNISDGNISIQSGDDGLHADASLTIKGGDIDIQTSYEGIESSELFFLNGTIHVNASDDGINAGGGNDSSSTDGRAGQNEFRADATKQITIEGGYLYIDANGDGIDSNGNVTMSGGTVIVNGPEDNANGALDYNGDFIINGGYLLATGSSGMMQTPTDITNGNCAMINFTSNITSLIHIQDSDGNDIVTYQPSKSVQSLVLYTSSFIQNSTYEIYTGGNAIGSNVDGLYDTADYTNGTLYDGFTTSSSITTIGSTQNTMGGGKGNMQPGQPPQR